MVQLAVHNLFLIYEASASGALLSFYHPLPPPELSFEYEKAAFPVNEIKMQLCRFIIAILNVRKKYLSVLNVRSEKAYPNLLTPHFIEGCLPNGCSS